MQTRAAIFIALIAMLTACTGTQSIPTGPGNATAWCGQFDYTGTFTKSEAAGRALGVSDAELIQGASIDQIIALAEAMGCDT
ncbi:hypothetical protein [Pseudohongiella sp. O18]|uniref:hypothetical protein n=1 Tax=Pseudohongiella sp. O18 TaxID=2904248 RepID=UPI001F39B0EA|nr:hypothetical protein [Pseudohongiella sp. O18]